MAIPIQLLLVEDSRLDALLLVSTLKQHGFDPSYERVQDAGSLQEALSRQGWDIVLSDCQMPKFSGLKALEMCKSQKPDTPFVMVTGAIGEELAAQVMKAGAADFILKSNLTRLGSVVDRELKESASRREKAQIQASLNLREQEYRALFDNALDSIIVFDSAGLCLAANPAACDLLGRNCREVIHRNVQDLFHGDAPEVYMQNMSRLIAEGQLSGELSVLRPDGAVRYIEFHGVANFLPGQHLSIIRDITAKKEAQRQLEQLNQELEQRVVERTKDLATVNVSLSQEIEERKQAELALEQTMRRERLLRSILQTTSKTFELDEILQVVTAQLQAHYGADRCLLILYDQKDPEAIILSQQARSDSEILPMHPKDVNVCGGLLKVHPDELPHNGAIHVNRPEDFPECLIQNRDKYGTKAVLAVPMLFQGISYGAIALHQCKAEKVWTESEITLLKDVATTLGTAIHQVQLYQQEQEARLEAQKANQQKSRVLGYVAHDFKNPLNGMKFILDCMKGASVGNLSEDQRESLAHLELGVRQLRSMVTDILDRARLDEGKLKLKPELVAVKPFLEQLEALMSTTAKTCDIQLDIRQPTDIALVEADPVFLRQILVNLLSNAIKYNKPGGKVLLTVEKSTDEKNIVWKVQDTGLGIPEDQIGKLFENFYRVSRVGNKQVSEIEGTGLGLAYIKRLVALHQGEIFVESIVGEGSTFTCSIPKSIAAQGIIETEMSSAAG